MIQAGHEGYSLHCTGCGAFIELTRGEARDPFRFATRKQSMTVLHRECDGYGNVRVARAALKLQRSAARAALPRKGEGR